MYAERPFALHVERVDSLSNCLRIDIVLPPDPRIANVSPPAGEAGTELTISGLSFGDEAGTVRFAPEVEATVLSWSDEQIHLRVPAGGTGGSFRIETHLGLWSKAHPFFIANPSEATLTLLQSTIFTPSCAVGACHGAALAGGLSLVEGESFGNLVSVGSAQLPGALRVEPFAPDNSFLIDKLENELPEIGLRMPLGGPYLSSEEIALVRTWIERGAMDD